MAWGNKLIDAAGSVFASVQQKLGVSGTSSGVLHVAQYPTTLTSSEGAFGAAAVSGTMAAGLAANSEIFQMRWTSATLIARVERVRISAQVAGTAFAAGVAHFSLAQANSWSADGSGGNAMTAVKRRQSGMAASTVGGLRASSTAALTAGTKTVLGNVAQMSANTGTATSGQIHELTNLWSRPEADGYPIYLAQNEGIIIRATVPATGTWTFSVAVDWVESLIANY